MEGGTRPHHCVLSLHHRPPRATRAARHGLRHDPRQPAGGLRGRPRGASTGSAAGPRSEAAPRRTTVARSAWPTPSTSPAAASAGAGPLPSRCARARLRGGPSDAPPLAVAGPVGHARPRMTSGIPPHPPTHWICRAPSARPQILLAEGDDLTARVIRHRLERDGMDVTVVRDGVSALQALADRSADVAIVDATLPGIDGLDLVRRIRLGEGGPQAPPHERAVLAGQRRADRARLRPGRRRRTGASALARRPQRERRPPCAPRPLGRMILLAFAPSRDAVLVALLALTSLTAALVVLAVVLRVVGGRAERVRAQRWARWEPAILDALVGEREPQSIGLLVRDDEHGDFFRLIVALALRLGGDSRAVLADVASLHLDAAARWLRHRRGRPPRPRRAPAGLGRRLPRPTATRDAAVGPLSGRGDDGRPSPRAVRRARPTPPRHRRNRAVRGVGGRRCSRPRSRCSACAAARSSSRRSSTPVARSWGGRPVRRRYGGSSTCPPPVPVAEMLSTAIPREVRAASLRLLRDTGRPPPRRSRPPVLRGRGRRDPPPRHQRPRVDQRRSRRRRPHRERPARRVAVGGAPSRERAHRIRARAVAPGRRCDRHARGPRRPRGPRQGRPRALRRARARTCSMIDVLRSILWVADWLIFGFFVLVAVSYTTTTILALADARPPPALVGHVSRRRGIGGVHVAAHHPDRADVQRERRLRRGHTCAPRRGLPQRRTSW